MAWFPWIQALAPVVGGAIDRSNNNAIAERNRRASATRIQTTVKDAKAAGINPLTAIGAGAANTTYQQPQQVGSSFGSSLSQAADALASAQPDPIAKQTSLEQLNGMKANNKLTEIEIQIKLEQLRKMRLGNGPPSNPTNTFNNPHLPSVLPSGNPQGDNSDNGRPFSRRLRFGGSAYNVSTNNSPAQQFEDEFGDFAGSAYGLYHLVDTYVNNRSRLRDVWGNIHMPPTRSRRRPTNTRNRYPLGQPTKIGRWTTFQ